MSLSPWATVPAERDATRPSRAFVKDPNPGGGAGPLRRKMPRRLPRSPRHSAGRPLRTFRTGQENGPKRPASRENRDPAPPPGRSARQRRGAKKKGPGFRRPLRMSVEPLAQTVSPNGMSRSRLPVAWNTPLPIAGAIGARAGSPQPAACTSKVCGTMWTLTFSGKLSRTHHLVGVVVCPAAARRSRT